jgi:hypothetical protein
MDSNRPIHSDTGILLKHWPNSLVSLASYKSHHPHLRYGLVLEVRPYTAADLVFDMADADDLFTQIPPTDRVWVLHSDGSVLAWRAEELTLIEQLD